MVIVRSFFSPVLVKIRTWFFELMETNMLYGIRKEYFKPDSGSGQKMTGGASLLDECQSPNVTKNQRIRTPLQLSYSKAKVHYLQLYLTHIW